MSGSPRSELFDDIYFAVEDGLEETKHVFLAGNRLPERWADRPSFTIAETGFGTGLNFLSTWKTFAQTATPNQSLFYISFEKYPLSASEIKEYLSVWQAELDPYLSTLVEHYPLRVGGWHTLRLSAQVTLLLIFDDVNRAIPQLNVAVDAWYLDGHAPAKNPDMWSETVFSAMGKLSRTGATFATFTAAGIVKRGLAEAGFAVTKARGFGRKRDMLIGEFKGDGAHTVQPTHCMGQRVAVIGGGLAGTAAAYVLTQHRYNVDIYEVHDLATGASGNPLGLFNPRFSAQRSAESDFYASAFALAVRTFKTIQSQQDVRYQECGSLHLVTDAEKKKRFAGVSENWGWHTDHLQLLNSDEATAQAGVTLEQEALFLPDAGVISPELLCRAYAQGATIYREQVTSIEREQACWSVNQREYDIVIIANAADCTRLAQTDWVPVGTVRGQVSRIDVTPEMQNLKVNLCYGGYCSIPFNGQQVVGSTFQPWLTETQVREEDHQQVIKHLQETVPACGQNLKIIGGRASLRTAAKDRVCIGGLVPDRTASMTGQVSYFPNLYISTAHGSHGLLSSLMMAEFIAGELSGRQVLPQATCDQISPYRFLERERKRHTNERTG